MKAVLALFQFTLALIPFTEFELKAAALHIRICRFETK
jgi:hypothetical protein